MGERARLDDTAVGGLVCPEGRKDMLVFDGTLKGFGVRVTRDGTKVFLLQYRTATGTRRLPIGTFGTELTTAQARKKAEALRGTVRGGGDPVAELQAGRVAAVAAKAAARRAAAEARYTLRRLVQEWETKCLSAMRESYRLDATRRLRLHLAGLMDLPAASITRVQAVQEVDRIAKDAGETTARRVLGYARTAYGWAMKRGALAANPWDGLPMPGREVKRDRVLTDEEIGAIWNATGKLGIVHGGFVRFLTLTLARRDEVARMTWGEVAPDLSTWTLPAVRAKNGKAHVTHLPAAARAILEALPRGPDDALVFGIPSTRGDGALRPITTFSFMARVLIRESKAEGWRFHDFRRTGVTVLASKGVPPHVADRLLNHVEGTIKGVAAIYQRHDFMAERRAALEAWAGHVLHAAS